MKCGSTISKLMLLRDRGLASSNRYINERRVATLASTFAPFLQWCNESWRHYKVPNWLFTSKNPLSCILNEQETELNSLWLLPRKLGMLSGISKFPELRNSWHDKDLSKFQNHQLVLSTFSLATNLFMLEYGDHYSHCIAIAVPTARKPFAQLQTVLEPCKLPFTV